MMVQNFIDGRWTPSLGQKSVDVLNPATGELLAKTPLGTAADADAAVKAAHTAFPAWRKTPATERVQYLFQLKTKLEANKRSLSEMITKEHGKTLSEAMGSVGRAIQMVETACAIPTLLLGENFEDIARDIDCSTVKRPLGVFAGIVPFNFPIMVPFWFWPFAIACGNTYVLKASERVPLTSMRICEILAELNLPPGVMNLVQGGQEVAESLCRHPLVKGISFVGSTPVAKSVYRTATYEGKRVQALGGAKNLMVVMPDAMEGELAEKSVCTAVESITGCAGERCLAGSLVLAVGDETYKQFKQGAVKFARSMVVGDGADPATVMGPLISLQAKQRVMGLIQRAVDEGAELLLDGRQGIEHLQGFFLKPTVLANIREDMEIAREEVFGPVILVGKVPTLTAAIQWWDPLESTCRHASLSIL